MTRSIIMGAGDGPGWQDAVSLTDALAQAEGCHSVVAASVHPRGRRSPSAATESTASLAVARVSDALSGEVMVREQVLCSDSVPGALAGLAAREDAAAIVIGSDGGAPVGVTHAGDVALELLQSSPCPVAVAPAGYGGTASETFSRIAVASDGSQEAHAAVETAARLAKATGARLDVWCVAEPSSLADAAIRAATHATPRDWAQGHVERVVRALGDDVEAAGEVLDGHVARALAQRTPEVDLLVLGSRGHGPVGRVLLGSVSSGVLRHASCPLLIVPRAATETG